MSLSKTSIQSAPFRPFEDQYLITSFRDSPPADDFPSLLETARACFGKRYRRNAVAALQSLRSVRS